MLKYINLKEKVVVELKDNLRSFKGTKATYVFRCL
jgi:small nuclear ribonucleoprotein (snRNP)-like protein